MKELKRLLKPLKKKLIIDNIIHRISFWLAVSLSAVFLILVFSKFVYVPFRAPMCAAIIVSGLAFGVILSLTKYKITDYRTAEEGDSLGCDERLITAYGILMNSSEKTPMEELVIKDAILSAKREEPHKKYKIGVPKKMLVISAVLVMASLITGFVPSAGVYELTTITKQALEEAETIEKSVNKDEALSKEFKEEYNKILKELKKDLKKAKDQKEARKLLNDAQKELKKLENKVNEDKNRIKNMLSDFSSSSDISIAMDMGDMTALSKALEKLALELESLTEEELEKLEVLLKETMENLNDEELKKLLEEALKALEEGNTAELSEALSKASSSSVSKASAASSAVRRTASSIAKAGDGTGKTATSTPVSDREGNGEGSRNGNGEGNGSGSGNGEGNGEGNGSGSGNGGGTGNGAGTGGNGRGFGHTEPEKVFSRNAEGLLGEEEQLQSQQTEDGEVTYSETKAGGVNGESVPYDTVVKQYMEYAMKETENGDIPFGMKEVIAEYFAGLEK